MTARPPPPVRAPRPPLPLRVAILAWTGFWTWFVVVDGLHDARTLGPRTYGVMVGFLAALWGPTVLAWRRPRSGGLAFAVVGVAAFVLFRHPFARWVFALPPVLFALALGGLAFVGRSRARA